MLYKNPIIPGFYPDPSVCRVGEDYYLVTSSFEYFPGVPVFHSRDLVNWRQIGHCLTWPSQLYLEKAKTSKGIWAPTIRHHQGKFYMITTNISMTPNQKHLIVSTDDPAVEWSEPVYIDVTGIDPSLFFDDDGTVYFSTTSREGLVQATINVETGELTSDLQVVWKGTGGKCAEAPHIYKINGTYYLMIAEGGTEYGHMVTIARSDNPWGPFESCPHNPILTHRSHGSPIQCTGHGDMVQDHRGNWWMVFLGTRPQGHPFCQHLGRETFLAPVQWNNEGWPVVGLDGRVKLEMEADCLPMHTWPEPAVRDDFDKPSLGLDWNFIRNPREADWSLSEKPGFFRLKGSPANLNDQDSPAFIGRRQQHFNCRATVSLDFIPSSPAEEAGLTVFMNPTHHYEIALRHGVPGRQQVFVRRRIGMLQAEIGSYYLPKTNIQLRIDADPNMYRFSFSLDGENWQQLGEGEARYLSAEVAGGFTGVYLGMYATGNGRRCHTPADFEWFDYEVLGD